MSLIGPETPDFQPIPSNPGSPELHIPAYSPEEFPYQHRLPEGRESDPFWHKVAAVVAMTDAIESGELDKTVVKDNDAAQQWIKQQGLAWWYTSPDALKGDVLMWLAGVPNQVLRLRDQDGDQPQTV